MSFGTRMRQATRNCDDLIDKQVAREDTERRHSPASDCPPDAPRGSRSDGSTSVKPNKHELASSKAEQGKIRT
jgi:hypothetical protein